MEYPQAGDIKIMLDGAQTIVIVQADNPDADSLGSALGLEHALGELGKKVYLYCAVEVPNYLRYLPGWDRVTTEFPKQFDASIIVDCSTLVLMERLQESGEMSWLRAKPCIVIDHHGTVDNRIDFATVELFDTTASSSSEIVCHLAAQLGWAINTVSGSCLMTGILGDTQGLANDLAHAETYRVMARLVELGVDRPALEEKRREYNRMAPEIFRYKGKLIEHTEFLADGRIAALVVPQEEINTYSPLYNPTPLVQNDMLLTAGVQLSIVFKQYDDGKVTAAIRANNGYAVADKVAEHMGGGGHPYASGFKQLTTRPFNEVKSECIEFATELLDNLKQEHSDETPQYAYQAS